MTTNISKLSANKFQLIFPVLPEESSPTAHRQFSINIIDTVLPGFSLNVAGVPYRGGSVKYEYGFDVFSDWTPTFFIDSNFNSYITLSDWIFSIANGDDLFGRKDQSYVCDAHLHILDNYDNKIVDIRFENIWPHTLGDVKMSYQDGEGMLIGEVTFSYDRFYKVE